MHYHNGSVRDVPQISARPEYIDPLSFLVAAPEQQPLTTYQKYLRWVNKKFGHPSTPQVGILSRLIADLSAEINVSFPNITLNKVVVTVPLVPALTQLDLNNAIEYAGLHTWPVSYTIAPPRLSEFRANFAREGNGLCKTY